MLLTYFEEIGTHRDARAVMEGGEIEERVGVGSFQDKAIVCSGLGIISYLARQ
jgi:hypothetical protein